MAKLDTEKALVSQVGALFQMNRLLEKARSTHYVPRHMVASMPGTAVAVQTLLKGMEDAMALVRQEAIPFLNDWRAKLNLHDGGIFRARLFDDPGPTASPLEVEADIISAELYPHLVGLKRAVELTVRDPLIHKGGRRLSLAEATKDLERLANVRIAALGKEVDSESGQSFQVVRFRVSIQEEARKAYWMRTHLKLL